MATYNLPDYRAKYFEHKDLDKIYGQPTIETIVKLLKQSKRNAQSVLTTLGGGQLGYLSLYLTTAEYITIPGATAFVRPTDPGAFVPTPNSGISTRGGTGPDPLTPADIATQKLQHDEVRHQYDEMQAIELTLRRQIVAAIEEEYLQALRNPITDTIQATIYEIFDFLKRAYGRLSPEELKTKEALVDNYVYDPATNVDTVFNCIQEFDDLCKLLENSKTDTQLVTYAYLIFQRTGIFMEGLKKWNSKPLCDRTFANFKLHMRQEYSDLQDVGGLSINNSLLNQANIIKELKEHQVLMANSMKTEFNANIMQTFQALNMLENHDDMGDFQENNENIATNNDAEQLMLAMKGHRDPILEQLLKQMSAMQTQLGTLTNTKNYTTKVTNKENIAPMDNFNPKTGQPWKRYCWSCGCCPHWSKYCPDKKRGHKMEATFKNRINGSNTNCL